MGLGLLVFFAQKVMKTSHPSAEAREVENSLPHEISMYESRRYAMNIAAESMWCVAPESTKRKYSGIA